MPVNRRTFIQLTAAALGGPVIARAETSTMVRRIGWFTTARPPPPAELQQQYATLRELGWVVGQNLLIDQRYVSAEMLPKVAEEFARLKVDLIVAEGTAATFAAKNATSTIPIVMWSAGDPVASGLVASLARPGGNITGFALLTPETDAKRLSLLRQLLPGTERVGQLINSNDRYFFARRQPLEDAYRSLAIQPIFVDIAKGVDLENAVAEISRQAAQAIYVPFDVVAIDDDSIAKVMRATLKYRLPTVVDGEELLAAGGLLSFDIDLTEAHQRPFFFIDKILRGAKPADLPIEQPTRFQLKINLKTARLLGITVPQSLLLRADQVIQ
jgi:ABC-type uncharacterized transport system substrate-binding protein